MHASGATAQDEEQSRQQSVRNGDADNMEIYIGPDHSESHHFDDMDDD